MKKSRRKTKSKNRTSQRGKINSTNPKKRLLFTDGKEFKPLKVSYRDKILKKEEKRLKRKDLLRLDRLTHPKFYVKRNFLGLPVGIKAANLTPLQRKKSEVLYTFNPSPKRLVICARRAMRREVLFAKKSVGKGVRHRKKTFNQNSKVRC